MKGREKKNNLWFAFAYPEINVSKNILIDMKITLIIDEK